MRRLSLEEWEKLPRDYLTRSDDPIVATFIGLAKRGESALIIYLGGEYAGQERVVHPKSVFRVAEVRRTYFIGYCELERGERCFRFDRLRLVSTSRPVATTPMRPPTSRGSGMGPSPQTLRWLLTIVLLGVVVYLLNL